MKGLPTWPRPHPGGCNTLAEPSLLLLVSELYVPRPRAHSGRSPAAGAADWPRTNWLGARPPSLAHRPPPPEPPSFHCRNEGGP